MPTKIKSTDDPLANALHRSWRSLKRTETILNEDTRTNGTVCTDHVAAALACIQSAQLWVEVLLAEEKADAQPDPPEVEAEEELVCHVCGEDIEPDKETRCQGCNELTCEDCMGDDEVCVECEED